MKTLKTLFFTLLTVIFIQGISSYAFSPWSGNVNTDGVPKDKVWKILFNKPILETSVNSRNFFVKLKGSNVDDPEFPVNLNFDGVSTVRVIPKIAYSPDAEYTLYIKDVYAKDADEKLSKPISLDFRIERLDYTEEKYFDFDPSIGMILKYHNDGPDVVSIPKSIWGVEVKSIASGAFDRSNEENKLIEVIIPSTVKSIGDGAFFGNNIQFLKLGESVTTIGRGAFEKNNITKLIIPDSVKAIENNAFCGNPILNLRLGNSVQSIGNRAFEDHKLKSLAIPDSVMTIGDYAFMSGDVNKIKERYTLSHLTLGKSVRQIGKEVFANQLLESVQFPKTIYKIGDGAFRNNPIKKVDIPENSALASIGDFAFSDNKLEVLSLPVNCKTIGEKAFYRNNISHIRIEKNVTSIGYMAFAENKINYLMLPDSLTSLGTRYGESSAFSSNKIRNLTLSKNLTEIPENAFQNNYIESLEIPEGVLEIKAGAFRNQNSSLTSLKLPKSLRFIENNAFTNNSLLREVKVYKNTKIDSSAFDKDCKIEVIDN